MGADPVSLFEYALQLKGSPILGEIASIPINASIFCSFGLAWIVTQR